MAEAAGKTRHPDRPWKSLELVTARGDIDPDLRELGFAECLQNSIERCSIIPVRSKKFLKANQAQRISGKFDDLLKGKHFGDICLWTDDYKIVQQLDRLKVQHIDQNDLRTRINRISGSLDIKARCDIILELNRNYLFLNTEPPELLIDENNNVIHFSSSALLPPEGRTFKLPQWVPQRIINKESVSLLMSKVNVSRIRDLLNHLRIFNVQEYNLTALVSSMVAESNRMVKSNPSDEQRIRRETVQALWEVYSSYTNEKQPELPEKQTIIIHTSSGKFKPANELYFGNDYPQGTLCAALYSNILPDKFVGSPEQLGLTDPPAEIQPFLEWLGVESVPRVVPAEKVHKEFLDFVISKVGLPSQFENFLARSLSDILNNKPKLKEVYLFESLKDVLDKADHHAIISWIAVDKRIENMVLNGDSNSKLTIRPPWHQSDKALNRTNLPSLSAWLFQNTPWLLTHSGDKRVPVRCVMARGVSKEIGSILGIPAIDLTNPIFSELGLDRISIRNALTRIGVSSDIEELPWDVVYELLLELPTIDPPEQSARSIYRALIGRGDFDSEPTGSAYHKFMREGKLYGREGHHAGYYPIQKLYYLHDATAPEHLTKSFALLELDKRRNTQRVKKLFGVETLNLSKNQIEVRDYETHPCSEMFETEIEGLKPYIYALRVEEDNDRSELRPLRQRKLKLCKSVVGFVKFGDLQREITLQNGESLTADSVTYLVADALEYDRSFLRDSIIADALGEIFSNILRVDLVSEIARITNCPVEQREELFNRITGGTGEQRLKKALELFDKSGVEEDGFIGVVPPPPPVLSPTEDSAGLEKDQTQVEAKDGQIQSGTVGRVVIAEKIVPTSDRPSVIISRRVKVNSKSGPIQTRGPRVDPDRAEELAVRFEEAEGRFPRKISHFQGLEAYGCDVISFRNEEDWKKFQQIPDTNRVLRFIEVKGSSSQKGTIDLKGNELRSAQKYRERFSLYRVFETETAGIFDLIEISDPLHIEETALRPIYEVNPFKSKKSKGWTVQEIKNSHEDQDK
jgi:hypothetical protein